VITVTMNTRDVPVSVSERRVWFAREQIMDTMQALGMPVSLDGQMIIIRNVDSVARWMLSYSDDGIKELFLGTPKFDEAVLQFESNCPPMNIRQMAPAGISIRDGSVKVDGCALRVNFPSSGNASEGPEAFVIPVSRKKMSTGEEWIETVAVIPKSILDKWSEVANAANQADRLINSGSRVLRIYNGPDITIQPIGLDDIVMDKSVRNGFADDIQSFLSRRDWYSDRGLPWTRKYILNGPPGTGKTSLMRWACTELGLPSIGFDFSDPYANASTFMHAIQMAQRQSPSIFSVDDLDKILAGENSTRITTHGIQTALSGMGGMTGVIFIATCNDPSLLLKGPMARRFDVIVDVNLPTENLRIEYLTKILSKDGVSDADLIKFAKDTDGWSFSDLMSAITSAANTAVGQNRYEILVQDVAYGIETVRLKKRSERNS